jgi:hypothetical protein
VDTHPIHFHLVNVQLINRVGWDNFITPPEPNELGWKETIKMSPLEDVIVAVRAKKPKLPGFGLPSSVRLLDPSQPEGALTGFTQIDPYTGAPATMANVMTDFGWEYVWHCHILGHEENDFMRPIAFRSMDVVPDAPSAVTVSTSSNGGAVLKWTDPTPYGDPASLGSAKGEIGFRVERAPVNGNNIGAYVPVGTLTSFPTMAGSYAINALANATTFTDDSIVLANAGDQEYRVVAVNTAGETASAPARLVATLGAPTNLAVTGDTASTVALKWTDNSSNEVAFDLSWASATAAAGSASFGSNATTGTATGLAANTGYIFTVNARDFNGGTAASNTVTGTTAPLAVTLSPVVAAVGTLNLSWTNTNPNIGTLTSVVVTGSVNGTAITPVTLAGSALSTLLSGLPQAAPYALTVTVNGVGGSAASTVSGVTAGVNLQAATGLTAQLQSGAAPANAKWSLNWADASSGETGYQVQICYGSATQCTTTSTLNANTYPGANATVNNWYAVPAANVAYTAPAGITGAASAIVTAAAQVNNGGGRYSFRVVPLNVAVKGAVSNISPVVVLAGGTAVAAPSGIAVASGATAGTATISWTDSANNNSGYTVQQRQTGGVNSVTLSNTGRNYLTAPQVTITAPAAGGVQATAHAVVNANGTLSVVIDNKGSGYTARPTVSFVANTGSQSQGGVQAAFNTNATTSTLGGQTWATGYTTSATTPTPILGTTTGVTVSGLISGVGYQFQIRADGVNGGVPASAFTPATGSTVVVAK